MEAEAGGDEGDEGGVGWGCQDSRSSIPASRQRREIG